MRKRPQNEAGMPDIPLDLMVEQAIRAFVVHARRVIDAGKAKPPLLQALVSLRRQERREDDEWTAEKVIDWGRSRTPLERARVVRELSTMDARKSGLA